MLYWTVVQHRQAQLAGPLVRRLVSIRKRSRRSANRPRFRDIVRPDRTSHFVRLGLQLLGQDMPLPRRDPALRHSALGQACGAFLLLLLAVSLAGAAPARAGGAPARSHAARLQLHLSRNQRHRGRRTKTTARNAPQTRSKSMRISSILRVSPTLGTRRAWPPSCATNMPRTPPEVVMTLGSAALPFIVEHRDAFAPKVPVVFTSVVAAKLCRFAPAA